MAHEILIVDDEADIRTLTSGLLEDEGFLWVVKSPWGAVGAWNPGCPGRSPRA